MKYTSIEKIEDYLLIDIDSAFKTQVENWILAIEAYIDKYTGRNFKADTEASAKKYEVGRGAENFGTISRRNLFIDECVNISDTKTIVLKIDDEVIDDGEYLVYPANSLPYTRIVLRDDSGYCFTSGQQNIEVEAKWGYTKTPPEDIVLAATVLVAGIISYSLSHEGEIASESIGGYSVSYKAENSWNDYKRALETLDQYRKLTI